MSSYTLHIYRTHYIFKYTYLPYTLNVHIYRTHYIFKYTRYGVQVVKTADGSFLYTFPKNFVGTIKFQPLPSAAAGSNLTVLLGEWLTPNPPK